MMRIGAILGLLLWSVLANAHAQYKPLSVNRYTVIAFEPPGVHLSYEITVGDVPAQKVRARFDADGDGTISRNEQDKLQAWFRKQVSDHLQVELDGQRMRLQSNQEEMALVSDQVEMFAPIRIRFHLRSACPAGVHRIVYHDVSQMPELEQTELFVRRAPHAKVLRAVRPGRERGVVRRMFWEKGEAITPVHIRFRLSAPAGEPEAADLGDRSELADEGLALKNILAKPDLGWLGLLAGLGLALLLGAMHALSPGHGKTLVAAYLVGAHGTVRHAILLGLTVTFTHVFSVVMLGVIALWASEHVLPERLAPWLSLVSAGLVTAVGAWMLRKRLQRHPYPHHHEHDHHDHEHDHHHPHPGVRLRELLALGISGGLVPCPSALVVLLFAVYMGRIGLGLLLIGAFSLGLAASLTIVGVLVVHAKGWLARRPAGPRMTRLAKALPLLSAVAICILGLALGVLAALQLFD